MKPRVPLLFVLFGALLSLNCQSGEERGDAAFHIDTLGNGAIRISNLHPHRGLARGEWIAIEKQRIGAIESDGPEQLEFPLALELDSRGRIWILEGRAQEVKVFFPDGRYSHRVGRKGEGPGELEGAAGLFANDLGQVIVLELKIARYSLFGEDGSFIESRRRSLTNALYSPWPAGYGTTGRFIDWSVQRPRASERGEERLVRFLPVILDAGLQPVDTLPAVSYELDVVRPRVPRPFSRDLLVHVDRRDQLTFAVTTEYRIFRRSIHGDTVRIFSLESQPQKVTSREVDSVVRSRRLTPGLDVTAAEVPAAKPILAHLTGDNDGHLFVFPTLDGEETGTVVDVFSEEGIFLDRVHLPVRLDMTPAPVVRHAHLLGVTRGPYDTPFVVSLSIGPAGGS